MKIQQILKTSALLALCIIFAGCASQTTANVKSKKKQRENYIVMINADGTRSLVRDQLVPATLIQRAWEWNPDLAPTGKVEMEIVLNEQRLYIYRNGVEIGYSAISTGREGRNTKPGQYKILAKSRDHVSNRWGVWKDADGNVINNSVANDEPRPPGITWEGAPMPYFLRLTWDGMGLHEGFLPGYPASAGCIRVHDGMASKIFEIVEVGTPVRIVNDKPYIPYTPWQGTYSSEQYPPGTGLTPAPTAQQPSTRSASTIPSARPAPASTNTAIQAGQYPASQRPQTTQHQFPVTTTNTLAAGQYPAY
jgi:hypothetical protein